ncbi:ATP-binding protein [Antarcticibacterium flavum]|uniref:ATP-binding protein n=1 Tax=Antarcticibacterium flavum TaxID=2058175 RepID=A0A5B7X528_9FLAO|nr:MULTISPECIES: ATP-binding protein [Antarcticibacterium]MCM4160498.1 nicotinate-nucleotide adenylyltransferase [Antarcticibacterium sp. W02-3]QCY69838.1 ATP-binding protein [Antarcticibacterium flavum]
MEEKLSQQPTNCMKAVLFGPESTGKTTLAARLAKHFNTTWVEEYMRIYLQKKWDKYNRLCRPGDLLPIAEGQMHRENELAKDANKILFCDTDLLEIVVYSEAYYNGYCNPVLLKHALNNWYDIYFLTNIDTPWVPDDLRDKPHDREGMFKRFKSTLQLYKRPYITLTGSEDERFEKAVSAINELLKPKI